MTLQSGSTVGTHLFSLQSLFLTLGGALGLNLVAMHFQARNAYTHTAVFVEQMTEVG